MKTRKHILPLAAAMGSLALAATSANAEVIALTVDETNTTDAANVTTKAGLVNDPFAYDPDSPNATTPVRVFSASTYWSGGGTVDIDFDQNYTDIVLDFWGRLPVASDAEAARNRNLTITFYKDHDTQTHQVIGWSGTTLPSDSPAAYGRYMPPAAIVADRVTISHSGPHFELAEVAAGGSVGPAAPFEITSITSVGSGVWQLTLEGESETAYEFRSSATLDFDPGTLVESLTDGVPAVGTIGGDNNSQLTTDVDGNGTVRMTLSGPENFVRAQIPPPPPPLYSWDFETDGEGFTATGTPDDWAWGTPNSNNDAGLVLTTGNGGSTGCWATNLGDGTGPPSGTINTAADSILRSPDLDLTGVTGAQLSFAAAVDAEDGDTIEILIREVGTDTQLGSTIVPITAPATADWADLGPFDLSAADNMNVYLEFRFKGTDAAYIGFYIDDVVVTQN